MPIVFAWLIYESRTRGTPRFLPCAAPARAAFGLLLAGALGGPSSRVGRVLERLGGRALVLPVAPFVALERVVSLAPGRLGRISAFQRALGISAIAER